MYKAYNCNYPEYKALAITFSLNLFAILEKIQEITHYLHSLIPEAMCAPKEPF